MKQFIADHQNIGKIWYNVEPLAQDRPRTKIDNATQLAMYIQQHPYFRNTYEFCDDDYDDWKWSGASGWIAKLICILDINITNDFVNQVEKGMTVYDWPAFALYKVGKLWKYSDKERFKDQLELILDSDKAFHTVCSLLEKQPLDPEIKELMKREQFLPSVSDADVDETLRDRKRRQRAEADAQAEAEAKAERKAKKQRK